MELDVGEGAAFCFTEATEAMLKVKSGSSMGGSCECAAWGSICVGQVYRRRTGRLLCQITAFHRHQNTREPAEPHWHSNSDKGTHIHAQRIRGWSGNRASLLSDNKEGQHLTHSLTTCLRRESKGFILYNASAWSAHEMLKKKEREADGLLLHVDCKCEEKFKVVHLH